MTLTTERQQFEQWWETAMHNGYPPRFGWEHWRDGDGYRDDDGEFQGLWQAWQASRELLANREAQPVAGELGEIRVGRLPTMNQENYPGLGDWWVQLRIGENHDEILARVYGATPEEAVARARLLTAPPAPAVPDEMTGDGVLTMHDCGYIEGWNACRAAMLAQPVSGGYTLNSPEIPDGWVACSERMPEEGDVVLVCQEGGIIYCAEMQDGELYPDEFPRVPSEGREITHWMPLPEAPEGGNDHDTRR